MTAEEFKKSIKEGVLAKIQVGQAKMKPKWYFMGRTLATIFTGVILAAVLVFLISFILFALKLSGAWFVPSFGARGLGLLFSSLPWILILVVLLFIVLLEWLIKKYSHVYHKPLLYSALGITLLAVVTGVAIAKTPLHQGAYEKAMQEKVPVVGPLYRQYDKRQHPSIHPGTVIQMTQEEFVMRERRGNTYRVIITPETRFPHGVNFATETMVIVIGEPGDGTISAVGVKVIDNDFDGFRKLNGRRPHR
jgi:glucan phosphoethanolaminetransferase (alkaline phosphatase superfamily)